MFKRVDRRRKRKEEEEELGLDEDEREILGLNNTDSSESDSDSSSSSSAQAPSGRSIHSKNKRKQRTSLSSHAESDDDEDSQSTSGDEVDDGEEDVADHLFSIASALKEPIQLISTDPEAWVCVFCPNKVLKHMAMVKVHEASQARKLRTWSGHRAYHAS
jgi:flagellar hook-length control protein FliK